MAPEEKKTAVGFTALGFLLGGPVGGIVAALAVGIEQAFIKAGWDKPAMFNHSRLTPEEWAERRRQLAAEAEEYFREARERAAARAQLRDEYRAQLKDWIKNGRDGDKPDRPGEVIRNPLEFLRDFLATSKAGYRLLDEKLARGNEKITGTYPVIGDFFKDLWAFVTGFVEGTRAGWQQYQESRQPAKEPATLCPVCGGENTSFDKACYRCRRDRYTNDGPNLEPVAELPPDGNRPPADPAPEQGADPEPGAGSNPSPEPAPTPLPGPEPAAPVDGVPDPAGELPTGPAGPSEGTVEGDVVTADGTTVLSAASGSAPAHAGPQRETNLDLIYAAFHPIPPLLRSVSRQMPDLLSQQTTIAGRLARIRTLAGAYGVPLEVWAYLAEAAQVSAALAGGLQTIQLQNARATELADAALAGLQPAADNLDAVQAQGASGELFANAAEAA
jgi:hypothetical protein